MRERIFDKDRKKYVAESETEIYLYDSSLFSAGMRREKTKDKRVFFTIDGSSEIFLYKKWEDIYNRLRWRDYFKEGDILVTTNLNRETSKGKLVIETDKISCIAKTIEYLERDIIIAHDFNPSNQWKGIEYFLGPESRKGSLRTINTYPENMARHKKYKEMLVQADLWGNLI